VSILRHLSGSGVTYLNGDDAHLKEAGRGNPKVKFFGTSSDCDFRINQKEKKENGYGFTLNRKKYFIPLQGEHNIYNAAAAAAVAGDLGVSREEIEKKLEALALPEMRLEKVDVGGVMFINDSYNANPSSFECALNVLKEMPARGKKGVVAGEMLELGKGSARFHQDLGKSIAGKKIDFLITVGEMAGNIARGALKSGMREESVFRAENHDKAAEIVRRVAKPEDVVLVKGSRATKMEEVITCFITSYIP
ncbi:MAG: cyanophycin synthetase, partial [Candidatus Omnitrophota bacterium]